MFRALWGTPVVTLRISMVYGPGQRDRRKLVPYVIDSLLQGHTTDSPAARDGCLDVR